MIEVPAAGMVAAIEFKTSARLALAAPDQPTSLTHELASGVDLTFATHRRREA
jgi:hypothetical protein